MAATKKFIGVTVLPEYFQSEGVEAVLDRLVGAGVTAITTSPYVMAPADEGSGAREPPADAGAGAVRLLDRPLWGRRELWVRTAPSFAPQRELYAGLRYQPPEPEALTDEQGGVIRQAIDAAHDRDLRAYFQVQAAIPPGYRVQFGGPAEDDIPRLPDGGMPGRRVANNGSLASPHIVEYAQAMIRDLCLQYPNIDGIRFDWPEYPPYELDSAFVDFGPHAAQAASELGFDFTQLQRDSQSLYERLHGKLTDADLKALLALIEGQAHWDALASQYPGAAEMLRFKAALSERLLTGFRRTMNEAGAAHVEMAPNAFPPPWSIASGFDFARAAPHSAHVCVKLYGMHWAMMLRFYGDQLLQANPQLSNETLTRALVRLLDIEDGEGRAHLADYYYPGPDEPHPCGEKAQARKIETAQAAAGATPIYTLAHGYGPLDDFRRRFDIAQRASRHGLWVNRYGYLSDEKLAAMRELAQAAG